MRSQKAPPAFANALGVSRPPERLRGLLRQYDRLLADVTRKRKTLERAREEVARVAAEVARRLDPIIEESRAIDAELHRLFAELLARPKLSKRARRAIRRVYDELQEDGILSPEPGARTARGSDGAPGFDPDDEDEADDDRGDDEQAPGRGPRPSRRGSAAGDQVASAAPAGANPTVRGLFLRLARALHPDRAQDARERAVRTETMKEINRAYREGDIARLAELERDLKARGAFGGSAASDGTGGADAGDAELDKRCAALEQTNLALHQQLKGLRRDLRALRDSDMGRMAADLGRRRGRSGGVDPFADLDADAAADLERFRMLRDHVGAFRDGEISLEDFLVGPPDDEEDEIVLDFDFGDDLAGSLGRRPRTAPRRKGSRRR